MINRIIYILFVFILFMPFFDKKAYVDDRCFGIKFSDFEGDDKNRPLLDSDDNHIEEKFERILKLLNDRKLLYQKIPFQIDTDDLDPDLISDMIITEYKK